MSYSNNGVLSEQIRIRILENHPKAKEHNKEYLQKLICPVCNKNEAFAYYEQPFSIICPRLNKCGVKTPIKELYPDLFENFSKRFPVSKKEPHATAKAYLISRNLDTSKFKFKQGKIVDDESNKKYQTVEIQIDKGITFHRLIDYNENKNKTRLYGKYKGKVWKPKNFNPTKETFIVESILDALSLIQVGIQAIATLSSSHLPEEFFNNLDLKKAQLILAFDGDEAGLKAIEKHISFFNKLEKEQEIKINYKVAIPPKTKDWNNLLQLGSLKEEYLKNTIEKCHWRGKLNQARTPERYFEIYCERNYSETNIFEFKHRLFKGFIKERKEGIEYFTDRLTDCSINILYSIEDDTLEYNSKTKHRLKCYSETKGSHTIEFTSEEFSQLNLFRSKLTNYKLIFRGGDKELIDLKEYLFSQKTPTMRKCNKLGYDKKSGHFVFSKFLYDLDGKRFETNSHGYFEKQNLVPFREQTIESITPIDLQKFLETLFKAYSYRGLLTLGFWVSSVFSHTIFNKFGFFPFLSLYGDPHCGKSDLVKLLNRCFFIDWEGISMTKANTQKGELRKISQKSSLVTPMLEGRKDKSRFDFDSILPFYNRNPLQLRALKTNENETQELAFDCTLAFVQNKEQFESKAAKERVVSILFEENDLSDETYEAWEQLQELSLEELAFVGHKILLKRNFFEIEFTEQIQKIAKDFRKQGIKVDRVAKNYAIPFIGCCLISKAFGFKLNKKEFLNFVLEIAETKLETARNENPLADHFFESLFELKYSDEIGSFQVGYIFREEKLIVHLPTVIQKMKEQDLGTWNKRELVESLNKVSLGKKSFKIGGKKKDCWFFDKRIF